MSKIPSWLVQEAPGAAAVFGSRVAAVNPIGCKRIRRLVSKAARPAWRETGAHSTWRTWELSEDDLYKAQMILAETAYTAPDRDPIGQEVADQVKDQLRHDGSLAVDLADRIRGEAKRDPLIENFWRNYCGNRPDNPLPASLSEFTRALDALGDFLNRYADESKPAGPRIAVVQNPSSERARDRAVIIQIGTVCRDHFQQPMHEPVAILAGLALDRPISKRYAREVLRNAGVV